MLDGNYYQEVVAAAVSKNSPPPAHMKVSSPQLPCSGLNGQFLTMTKSYRVAVDASGNIWATARPITAFRSSPPQAHTKVSLAAGQRRLFRGFWEWRTLIIP